MVTYQYGGIKGKRYGLSVNENLVVVRTWSRRSLSATLVSRKARGILDGLERIARFPHAGVEIFRCRDRASGERPRSARTTLDREPDTQFAGRVLADPKSGTPVIYTENFFVKFKDDITTSGCKKILKTYRLNVKRELEYARNVYFVSAPEGTGQKVFSIATRVLKEKDVDFCHPELIRQVQWRGAFTSQWHLKKTTVGGQVIDAHAHVEYAWVLSQGEGTTVAVIDDGVDLDHEEFIGSGKIVAPRDVTRGVDDARPGTGDNHGTACAGVACANGQIGSSGVAPKSRLLPIRLASALGSQQEADAFYWAATHGADVISCSWGPRDGDWSDPNDPVHNEVVPLPDSTRLAIDWAVTNGRNGKGCVITWAAGNGNESVDNDGYASYGKVIAVAACNAKSRRSVYSDFGKAVWCAFPSNDFITPPVPGIWTTDRSGVAGYNPGQTSRGDAAGNYVNDFGGTSSACPGVAGIAALILGRNPSLRWDEVKDIIKRSCEKIDKSGGQYDTTGHSKFYGYGRPNAKTAVDLATPAMAASAVVHTSIGAVPIWDLKTSRVSLQVPESQSLTSIKIGLDIEHTYIGDLVVSVKPPTGIGVNTVILHDRTGGGKNNLIRTFDRVDTPLLSSLIGKSPKGKWTLVVQDKEKQDTGRILRFSVELSF